MIEQIQIRQDIVGLILNFNSFKYTALLLNQISRFEKSFHVVIVDNCSTNNDEIVLLNKLVSQYSFAQLIVAKQNRGYAAGNNLSLIHI